MLEEQIYRGFPSARDAMLMREFHQASWPGRVEIAERFEDGRYRRIAMRIIFNHRPDLLSGETRKVFSAAVARRWLAEGKPKWVTIARALDEIDARREGCSFEEALFLEALETYFREKRVWAEAHVA